MSAGEELRRVKNWFSDGTLINPAGPGPDFTDFCRALYFLAGTKDVPLRREGMELAGRVGPADHFIFVLLDGLGMNMLGRCPAGGFLQSHVELAFRANFLSTTAAALTTLATLEYPAQHGVLAWWLFLKKHGIIMTVLPFVERFTEKPLADFGVTGDEVFTTPSAAPRMAFQPATFIGEKLAGSIYTRYVTGGTQVIGYKEPEDALAVALERIRRAASQTFTYIYVPQVDGAAHPDGIDCSEVSAFLRRYDEALGRLADELPAGTKLVVTGDHGHVDADVQLFIDEGDPVLQLLECPPTGESTVPFFHARAGMENDFAAMFHERFGNYFALLTAGEVEELRLLGPAPLSTAARAYLGTHIAIAPRTVEIYFRPRSGKNRVHKGVHAGLTPSEMLIPLILA